MKRSVSHTEIATAMDCQAKHAFGYTGHLTGGVTLRPRTAAVRLREGRAWGRAVAALHAVDDGGAATPAVGSSHADLSPALFDLSGATAPGSLERAFPGSGTPACGGTPIADSILRFNRGLRALGEAIREDAREQIAAGVYNETEAADLEVYLSALLWDYHSTSEPLALTDPEIELEVPIPSRTGRRASTRFVFQAFLDGLTVVDGHLYIVEFKLRKRLTSFTDAVRGRQYRRYAWAAERLLDREVAGVILDERLNEVPKPARILKNGLPSHAKDQLTTADLYLEACREADVLPVAETITHLEQRRWQVRHVLTFRRSEIAEAGRELVSAAHLISQLDAGALWPVRNESPLRCGGCQFREPCQRPDDFELIDLGFERRTPKRDKELEVAA